MTPFYLAAKHFWRITFLLVLILIFVYPYLKSPSKNTIIRKPPSEKGTFQSREAWMQCMLRDPLTGKIPDNILSTSMRYAVTLPSAPAAMGKNEFGFWSRRGPYHTGGRTKAVAIDVNNENILIAGSVTGGIWRSENKGTSWWRVSSDTDSAPITSIVQDTRKNKTHIWYASAGEFYGLPNGWIMGNGLRKSVDGGKTWLAIASTYSNTPQNLDNFDVVMRVATNKSIDSIDAIFVASYNGIWRSNDGGNTWSRRRGANNSSFGFNDVAVDKNGVVYAAISGVNADAGIWRSINNGQNWTNITPSWFNTDVGRMVISIAPSDPNQIYFLAYTPGQGVATNPSDPNSEWNSLWHYQYVSGDGSGTGGVWENRSTNLPVLAAPGAFDNFYTQSGSTMHIDVAPDNPNTVFIGGNNLYRNTDGFKSKVNTTCIGGYQPGARFIDLYSAYPNHHPDQHGVVFFPSDVKKAISIHDGGISYTDDCLNNKVTWKSLNNGYVVTQFYSVGIDHHSNSSVLLGGMQDIGVLVSGNPNYYADWANPVDNGDGGYCVIGSGTREFFTSAQGGEVDRYLLNPDYTLAKMSHIDPHGVDPGRYIFINPYVFDEKNDRRMYQPNGYNIWRNQDINQIPLHDVPPWDTSSFTAGWEKLTNAALPDTNDNITAIHATTTGNDDVFYGTLHGKLFKITQASVGNPAYKELTGTNFSSGYINCIATHPNDTNKLWVVFSNYNVQSLYYSEDGGSNWVPVGGNLEQNANGTGNGPSCRWFTVVTLPDTTLYFVGTSTGLFATGKMDGMKTIWTRQGVGTIGYANITMMDYRKSDHLMAVATFGSGIYTSVLSSRDISGIHQQHQASDLLVYPNPAHDVINFHWPEITKSLHYRLYSLSGKIVLQGEVLDFKSININQVPKGNYILYLGDDKTSRTSKIIVD